MGRNASRRKIINRGRTEGSYSAWPHVCARSENFKSLSVNAKALLFEFLGQYNGNNNGDLCCAWKLMKCRGWNSRTTVEKARAELENSGWVVRTQQGCRNKPNLYALTIYKINDIAKLDERETDKPLGFWKHGSNPWLMEGRTPRPKAIFFKYSSCVTRGLTCTVAGQLGSQKL